MVLTPAAQRIARRISVARGDEPADLLIRNANVVNVFLKKVELKNVAVVDGYIAGIYPADDVTDAKKVIDAEGKYLIPGLIDAHTHVEMSYTSAVPFAEGVLPHGTTTVIMDPHDTVNAMGNDGMSMLAEEFTKTPLKVILMTPPCVPSAPIFEDAGFEVTRDSLVESMKTPLVKGIAETMDFNRVLSKEPGIMEIIAHGRENSLLFDGHAPCVVGRDASAYYGTGPIRTDHESIDVEEAYEKYGLGVHIIIRRGSIADPIHAGKLTSMLPDTSGLLLATDGTMNVHDIIHNGHMNYVLKQVVAEGVDPVTAVQMATINTARAHHIDHKVGAIAPGLEADMVLLEDLKDFKAIKTFVNGAEIPENPTFPRYEYPARAKQSIKIKEFTPDDIKLEAPGKAKALVRALTVQNMSLDTTIDEFEMAVENGEIKSDISRDLLKCTVIERYGRGKGHSVGIIRGFDLKKGAIAGSIGQDTQNIIALGTNDADICAAINELARIQGGMVLVEDGEVKATIELPIFGIMTEKTFKELEKDFVKFFAEYAAMGGTLNDPVFTLSLLIALVVIPDGGISNRGLVDVMGGNFLDVVIG